MRCCVIEIQIQLTTVLVVQSIDVLISFDWLFVEEGGPPVVFVFDGDGRLPQGHCWEFLKVPSHLRKTNKGDFNTTR